MIFITCLIVYLIVEYVREIRQPARYHIRSKREFNPGINHKEVEHDHN